MQHRTTFVTFLIDLSEPETKKGQRDPSRAIEYFVKLASTGINIHAFISSIYIALLPEEVLQAPTVHVSVVAAWKDTPAHTIYSLREQWQKQPFSPTPLHDTPRFMALQLSKTEYVASAIGSNVFGASHFAWIDFSIAHVFAPSTMEETLQFLVMLGDTKLIPKFLAMPGCSSASSNLNLNHICWRFCGGFFIGDRDSVLAFADKARALLATFVAAHDQLVWEVSFWAWLEAHHDFNPTWYKADHTDSIVTAFPRRLFWVEASLTTIPPRLETARKAIASLSPQVNLLNLTVSRSYQRFPGSELSMEHPGILALAEEFRNLVVHWEEDVGPAAKVLGVGDRPGVWTFIGDDDQVYTPDLVRRMMSQVSRSALFQNRFDLVRFGDGGIVHGFVGYIVHSSLLRGLRSFPRPAPVRWVDDQWLSAYCFYHSVSIMDTGIHRYDEIFQELENNHELLGSQSLSVTGPDRKEMIRQLGEELGVEFIKGGKLARRATG
jgi:hypothetical protein